MKNQDRKKSELIFRELEQVIPGGVNSPVRACTGLGVTPLVIDRAYADVLVDADDNEYIDYCMSWGALIHGHANPTILKAVQERLLLGTSYGCTTKIEEELARKIVSFVPSVEKVRFVSSGTEATMSAVRLARGYTGKNCVITFAGCYHGHSDTFLVEAGSGLATQGRSISAGVPEESVAWTVSLPYNDIEAFDAALNNPRIAKNLACVILEPVAANMGLVLADVAFLEHLRKRCRECGALLIFDEVITGFRLGKAGAQGYYGITPDLSCFGKIIGGGFPCGAFGGKSVIMDHLAPRGGVYQAGTLSGNPIAMQAGLVSLSLLEREDFFDDLENKKNCLIAPLKEYIAKHKLPISVASLGSCFTLFFTDTPVRNLADAQRHNKEQYAQFFRHLLVHGIYFPPAQLEIANISSMHTQEHLCMTRDVCIEYIRNQYV